MALQSTSGIRLQMEPGLTMNSRSQPMNNRSAKTGRVIIRPPELADCAAFLRAAYRSRKLHGQWINPKARTRKEFATYLERFKPGYKYGFLVIDRASGEIAGVININDIIRGCLQSASLGYYAFVPYARQGLMFEGMQLVIKYAFQTLKLHRLEANIQPGNQASQALARKCGFVNEGCARRFVKVRGRWKDHQRWALLRESFRSDLVRNRRSQVAEKKPQ
jgi:[ribosomal protein S5]-alanine N-acetyltransferase